MPFGVRLYARRDAQAPSAEEARIADVAIAGGRAFLVDATAFRVLDVRGAATPVELGRLESMTGAAVALTDDVAWVASGRLSAIDVSDPTHLAVLGEAELGGAGVALAVEGGVACVGAGDAGVVLLGVGDPRAPCIAGRLAVDEGAWDVRLRDGIAYVLTAGTLVVIDARAPARPSVLARVALAPPLHGLALAGGVACIAAARTGVRLLDVRDPAHPLERGRLVGGMAVAVDAAADLVWVLESGRGVSTWRLSETEDARREGFTAVRCVSGRLRVAGGSAFVASHQLVRVPLD